MGTIIHGTSDTPRKFYYHIIRFQKSCVTKVHVNGLGFLGRAKYFWETRGKPTVVVNGGEANYQTKRPKGLVVSNGNIQKWESEQACVQWNDEHEIIGISNKLLSNVYNAVGGSNVLLEDGDVPLWLYTKFSVDPRTAIFWNDTEYILILIDGRSEGRGKGLTLAELAKFGRLQGAKWGLNLDGGDSCQGLYEGELINVLPDGIEHSVINHVGFWTSENDVWYSNEVLEGVAVMNKKFRCVEQVRLRDRPSFFGNPVGDLLAGQEFVSMTTSEEVLYSGEVYPGPISTLWEQHPNNYWIPHNHHTSSNIYLEEIVDEEPDPIEPGSKDVKEVRITYDDGSFLELVPK